MFFYNKKSLFGLGVEMVMKKSVHLEEKRKKANRCQGPL